MKKQLTIFNALVLIIGLMGMTTAWGQQVIGSYPSMDGGFEGQTTGSTTAVATIAADATRTDWTNQGGSPANSATINATGGRSGDKYITFSFTGTGSHRRLQSPTTTGISASTTYVVQFYYRNNGGTTLDIRGGGSQSGTGASQYAAYDVDANQSSWHKYAKTFNTNSTASANGIGVISVLPDATGGFDIDDFVIYAGTSVDETAPNSPGTVTIANATQTSLDVSWGAASGGVDGGGYVVVRYATNPNADNDPNQNGIYAVGNTITNGTDNLVGTVRYIGTGTSFTDNVGLVANTQYWYKVYTVDKAFNYSDETVGNGTTLSGVSPSITATPASLSGFTYVAGSGPSAEDEFEVSGVNLTDDITITPPANYEISLLTGVDFAATNPIILDGNSGEVVATTIYVRLKSGLTANTYNGEEIEITSDGATNRIVTLNGNVTAAPDPEPTNHVTNFTATVNSYSQITLTWDDATGAQLPAAYLVKAAIDPATPTAPVDGTEETNALLVKNIAYGVEEAIFSGLDAETTYNFAIWPYTNSGTDINYKIGGEPTAQALTLELPDTLAYFMFENNLDAESGAIGNPDLIASTSVSYFGGVTGNAGSFGTAGGKYFELSISTKGYEDISFSWYARRSSTVGTWEVTASSDGSNFGGIIYNEPIGESFAFHSISLDDNFKNKDVIKIRFTGNDGYAGTLRIDDLVIYGKSITDATYNTIAIDGANSGWNAGEVFANITPTDNNAAQFAHFTWDEDYLYFAIAGTEAADNNMATFMFFNTAPQVPTYGTTDVYAWDDYIVAPFKANMVFVWKNASGADYMELRTWDPGTQTWGVIASETSNYLDLSLPPYNMAGLEVGFQIGSEYREVKIPRLVLGVDNVGDQIKVASFTEQRNGTWRYFGWPAEGWTDGDRTAGQTMTHAYHYTLEEFVYPNEAQYLKKDIIFTSNTTINDDVAYDNVYIDPNIHLEVAAGKTLTVNGDFTILSDASGTGSFIDAGILNVGGTTTAQKYLPNTTTDGWYVASPVSAAPYSTFIDSDGLYVFNASGANWTQLSTSGATVLSPATGYVSKFQNWGDYTVAFSGGNLNTGDVISPILHRTGWQSGNFGWNLVGNPYPSTINWNTIVGADNNAFVAANSVSATIYVRKADGNIATYNANAAGGTNGGTEYIAPMQAFWVQVDGDNGNITNLQTTFDFLQAARVSNPAGLLKSHNAQTLRLSVEKDGFTDETLINFNDNATVNFDAAYDGEKFFSNNDAHPQIYSILNNNVLTSINTLPALVANTTVDLGFLTNNAGQHTITAGDLSSFDSNVSIHLEDTQDNILIDLRQQNVYTFNAAQGTANDRFVIHFGLTTTDAETLAAESHIGVYANEKNIYISNAGEKAVVSVFNMLGQEVLSEQLQSHTLNKIATTLSTGQYIVRVTGSNGAVTERIFID